MPQQSATDDEPEPIPARRRVVLSDGTVVPVSLDEAKVREVVYTFYRAVRADPVIGPIFEDAIAPDDWPRHLGVMVGFWSSMLLGTRTYDGRPMPKHIQLPGLDDVHFAIWLKLFRDTVAEVCEPEVAALFVDRAERVAHSFRLGLAYFRGRDTTTVERMEAAKL
ncbi:group III truncated hemoglobin [Methyloraptor flagellatus]|uniref:Group III truncated hemoglobin n=1 Tax=Methyloraptor flagellatus TaxID=3162530 RepID=A0AAU7XDQ2_9HYPH